MVQNSIQISSNSQESCKDIENVFPIYNSQVRLFSLLFWDKQWNSARKWKLQRNRGQAAREAGVRTDLVRLKSLDDSMAMVKREQADGKKVVCAINADFFHGTYRMVGLFVDDGQIFKNPSGG